jgi:diguanylate cyclase (GGDEF)-like protein
MVPVGWVKGERGGHDDHVIEPPIPVDDAARVASLRGLDVLDTPTEERFDRITRLAQRLFDVPMAAVTLVDEDRQWLKSLVGPLGQEGPRRDAFCAHGLVTGQPMLVPDAAADERFAGNPAVVDAPNIRFYAGIPLSTPEGYAVGMLCVMDDKPREIDAEDVSVLRDLAEMVEHELAVTELAINDELTGLVNRRGFLAMGRQLLDVCERQQLPATLVYGDLDGLKPINDQQGHEAGDVAIRAASDAFASSFRRADVVGRMGGDELCALLFATDHADEAIARLRARLERQMAGTAPACDISLGTAVFDPLAPVSLDALIAAADRAMYVDKRSKPGRR